MTTVRSGHAAAALADGTVLVAGGYDVTVFDRVASAENLRPAHRCLDRPPTP